MTTKSTNNLKKIVRQIIKAKNENNKEKLLQLLAPEFVAHVAGMPHPLNRNAYLEAVQASHEGFAPLVISIDDMIEEKDKIAVRIIVQGKHTGDYQGHEASLHKIKYYGIIMSRIVKGKVVEEWQVNDVLHLLRQIGLSVNHIV